MQFWREKHERFIYDLSHFFAGMGEGLGTGFAGMSFNALAG